MIVISSVTEIQQQSLFWRKKGLRVAVVPTMGCLHEGHLSLIRLAKAAADKTILTLFVNPMQFGEAQDLSNYPRQFSLDCELAKETGADCIFAPSDKEMYPTGYQTTVSVQELAKGFEGEGRPGHFDGVASVVTKLFNCTLCDVAVFGEKDFQQLCLIRQMVADLNFPIEIIGGALIREADGLAMSSRNKLLKKEEREIALGLSKALFASQKEVAKANEPPDVLVLKKLAENIIAEAGATTEYVAIIDERTLEDEEKLSPNSRMLVAAKVGGRIRLLDNASLACSKVSSC